MMMMIIDDDDDDDDDDIKVYRHINTKRVIHCQSRCKLPNESMHPALKYE